MVQPSSRLGLEIVLTQERIQKEVSRYVPSTLDQGKEDLGPPGRISYLVTRGPFEFDLRDGRLVATTRIQAEVQLCKPLGPLCITYGRCNPSVLVVASVPVVPGEDYRIGPSLISTTVEQGCMILGQDATPRVRALAEQQAASAKHRIDSALAGLRPLVESAWGELSRPLELEDAGCFELQPRSLVLVRPDLALDRLRAGCYVEGLLAWKHACSERASGIEPLPAPRLVEGPVPETRAEIYLPVAWQDLVSRLLERHHQPSPNRIRIIGARARPALVNGRSWVALGLETEGTRCRTFWLVAEPWYDVTTNQVTLRKLLPAPGSVVAPEDLEELTRVLGERARVPVPVGPHGLKEAIRLFLSRVRLPGLEPLELDPRFEETSVERVIPARRGLLVVVSIRARPVAALR